LQELVAPELCAFGELAPQLGVGDLRRAQCHDLAQACYAGLQGNKEKKEKSWARWSSARPSTSALFSFFPFSSCKAHRALPFKTATAQKLQRFACFE
jgi:hypothetical protein